jgi:monoamine oxidase
LNLAGGHVLDTVVVGAGAAGLGAARLLAKNGLDVLVVEARDRIGGRGHTMAHASGPLDLGCEWLHSADVNPWVAIAEESGFAVERTPAPWGTQVGWHGFTEADQRAYRAATNAFYECLDARALSGPDFPASDCLEPGGRWNDMIGAIWTYVTGGELDQVSALDYQRYRDTGSNWRVLQGYGALIAAHGSGLPIRLSCPVSLIDLTGRSLMIGTPHGGIAARTAIVTVPSDVIAEGGLRFRPDLPEKRKAAEGLPLGLADKLMLAVLEPGAVPMDSHARGRTDRVRTGSYGLQPLGRPMIECYFGGNLAAELEAGGEAAFVSFALDELTGLFGESIRRKLSPIVATAWRQDPFSRGSYSYARPGRADDRARLAESVDDRLFFAGEACSRHDFSTAHGAYLTGIEAARAASQALARLG